MLGFSLHQTHALHIRCDHTVRDLFPIIMKVHFYVVHTDVSHIVYVSAEAIYLNILLCQYINAYVYIVHTCVSHIIGC